MQQRRALGRGIESLIPPPLTVKGEGENGYRMMSLERLVPNRQQPRTIFDEEKIRELADSMKENGILQPLVVSPLPDGRYELIAGERRLRAARIAGLAEVPVVIKSVDQDSVLALSILENIQREDLTPIEEAMAYQELIHQYQTSQEDVARRVGKSRVAVTNSLRLLKLPRLIQEDVTSGRYSAGHARAMLGITSVHDQLKLRELIIKTTPTVRDVERMVQERGSLRQTSARRGKALDPKVAELIEKMKQMLGTKVMLKQGKGGKGQLVIEYYSSSDFDRICRRLVTTHT